METTVTKTVMETILAAMTDVTGLIASTFTLLTSNPLFLFFIAASLVPIGFRVFKMAKSTAKNG